MVYNINKRKYSTKGKRLSLIERNNYILSEELKQILIGILLGDAHIVQRSLTSNSRLVYAQSAIKNKNYFNLVLNKFLFFCVKDYKPQSRIIKNNRTKKTYSSISFTTMQLPCFNEYRKLFYTDGIKTVPDNIYTLLTPISLAYWIMDDGSKQNNGLHLNVYAFSNNDVDKLMFTLQDKFNLKCSIHYHKDKKPRIYIFEQSMDYLRFLIKDHLIEDMLYKLSL